MTRWSRQKAAIEWSPGLANARLRSTMLFAVLFTGLGAAALVIVNWAGRRAMPQVLVRAVAGTQPDVPITAGVVRPAPGLIERGGFPRMGGGHGAFVNQTLDATTLTYLRWSAVALVVLALLGVWISYWLAGRTLQPVQVAMDRERRLVANMAHELRTPLAAQRLVLEVAMDGATPGQGEELMEAGQQALDQNQRAEGIIQAMLTLARANHASAGHERMVQVDLTNLVQAGLAERQEAIQRSGLTLRSQLDQAQVAGYETLLAVLVGNLLDNAIAYNLPQGWVEVSLEVPRSGAPRLTVANSGPVVAPEALADLTKPFRRGTGDRLQSGQGQGLGLSIVEQVVAAHGATLLLNAPPEGGLVATVDFRK